jgi:hypothetical protein
MRGWSSVLTIERNPANYRNGLFVASAELDVVLQVRPALIRRWPHVQFAILAPHGYASEFTGESEVLWLEDLKAKPLRSLLALRRRRFDLCVVLFAGRPTFRKLKLAVWLLNAERVIFYNEHGGSVVVDRKHWKQVLAHAAYRVGRFRFFSLFFPAGFVYLGVRTMWLIARAKLVSRKLQGIS